MISRKIKFSLLITIMLQVVLFIVLLYDYQIGEEIFIMNEIIFVPNFIANNFKYFVFVCASILLVINIIAFIAILFKPYDRRFYSQMINFGELQVRTPVIEKSVKMTILQEQSFVEPEVRVKIRKKKIIVIVNCYFIPKENVVYDSDELAKKIHANLQSLIALEGMEYKLKVNLKNIATRTTRNGLRVE